MWDQTVPSKQRARRSVAPGVGLETPVNPRRSAGGEARVDAQGLSGEKEKKKVGPLQ